MTKRDGLTRAKTGWVHEETGLFIEQVHPTRWRIWEDRSAARRRGDGGLGLDHCASLGEALEAVDHLAWERST